MREFTAMSTDRFGSLSEDQLDAIHAVCSRLQESWKNGRPLSIEQVLSDSDEVTRDVVLREVVACEIGLRRSRGEQPCFDDYFMRFPDQKETIENALAS